jgi:hypothetical protein
MRGVARSGTGNLAAKSPAGQLPELLISGREAFP